MDKLSCQPGEGASADSVDLGCGIPFLAIVKGGKPDFGHVVVMEC